MTTDQQNLFDAAAKAQAAFTAALTALKAAQTTYDSAAQANAKAQAALLAGLTQK